jgi:hypothetical protein
MEKAEEEVESRVGFEMVRDETRVGFEDHVIAVSRGKTYTD